jgi:hypothetical protein
MAESSADYLDRAMWPPAKNARASKADHGRVDPVNHTAGKANLASAATPTSVTKPSLAGAANATRLSESNPTSVAKPNLAGAANATRLGGSNPKGLTKPHYVGAPNATRLGESSPTGVTKPNPTGAANHPGMERANPTGIATAIQAGTQRDLPPALEASQIDQFGPLPLTNESFPPVERKFRRDRRAIGESGPRIIILHWLPGLILAAGFALCVAWALTSPLAQQQPVKPKPAAAAPAKPAKPAEAPKQQQEPSMPVSTEQTLYLIRSTLLTLNDANRSGNYTVLRDLAAPDFQARNTAADLSQSFSDLRHRNFDLYGAALLAPQLTAVPALDQRGYLHLTGFFPTRPQQIDFDLLFANVANQWRLFGVAITTPQAPTAER